MVFWIIQICLTLIAISIIYLVFVFFSSMDFSTIPQPFDGLTVIILTALFSYVIIILLLAIINKMARFILNEKTGEITGFYLAIWVIKETTFDMARTITKKFIIHSPIPDTLYRLFGMKKKKSASVIGTVMDVELLDFGNNCMIGTGAIVSGHHIRRGILYRNKVKIGDNVTIGANTIVLPGVEIGDNVLVSALSLIPTNSKLEGNAIYAGNPVKLVKKLQPREEK